MTKKMLVLGTNAGQADLIRHMKERDWIVEACAHRAGGPGEALSDVFHLVDIRDIDAVTLLAKAINADIVYSISSDLAMQTAIAVSENLGLPHFYDSQFFELLAQKPALRKFLNERKISEVPYVRINSLEDAKNWATYPCMVKPSDSQGQRGVVRVDQEVDLLPVVEAAIGFSQDSGTAIVEAFLEGVEVSCNVLVRNGEIIFDVLSERLVHSGSRAGIPRGHLVPCVNVSAVEQDAAIKLVHEIVDAFGRRDGCLYFQMIITPSGPKIVEIAPRLDGCHMWRVIEAATGASFLSATVDALLSVDAPSKRPSLKGGDALYELMFQQSEPGHSFDERKFVQPDDVIYHEYRYSNGEDILAVNGKLEVVGYYVRCASPADHKTTSDEAL